MKLSDRSVLMLTRGSVKKCLLSISTVNTKNSNIYECIPVLLQHLINYEESTGSSGSIAD